MTSQLATGGRLARKWLGQSVISVNYAILPRHFQRYPLWLTSGCFLFCFFIRPIHTHQPSENPMFPHKTGCCCPLVANKLLERDLMRSTSAVLCFITEITGRIGQEGEMQWCPLAGFGALQFHGRSADSKAYYPHITEWSTSYFLLAHITTN